MNFLLDYDRTQGRLISLEEYSGGAIEEARAQCLRIEPALVERGEMREAVTLQAHTLDDHKRTHRRYFARLEELAT